MIEICRLRFVIFYIYTRIYHLLLRQDKEWPSSFLNVFPFFILLSDLLWSSCIDFCANTQAVSHLLVWRFRFLCYSSESSRNHNKMRCGGRWLLKRLSRWIRLVYTLQCTSNSTRNSLPSTSDLSKIEVVSGPGKMYKTYSIYSKHRHKNVSMRTHDCY